MQTISAVMLLLGCSHNVQVCEPTELNRPYYETIAQCEDDISAQRHFADEGFPVTVVKCLEVDKLSAAEAIKIQWHFSSEGTLIAYAGPVDGDVLPDPNANVQLAQGNIEPAAQ